MADQKLWRFVWWYAGDRHVEWFKTRKAALKRCGQMLNKGYAVEGVMGIATATVKQKAQGRVFTDHDNYEDFIDSLLPGGVIINAS